VQTVQQQYTTASHVGLIFTLEPLFSAIVAYFLADEVLLPRGYVGAALMLASLVIMEAFPNRKTESPN
ncbi:MAG: EamA family transporter, partial [Clostridia bacterium]|nr:EamA family transporter [Clostridia bacterium]